MTQGRLYTQDLNQFTGRGIPMIRELAKLFGVAEGEVKSLVESGKVGFPEVQKVIQSLTNEGGMFFNLMEEQSKTITGQISNIGDSISTMYNNIGKSSEGFINDALSGVSYLVENYEQIGKTIVELSTVYGTYKAVLMSVAAYQGFAAGITYSAEIAELSKLVPLKKQSSNEDLIAAVASGKLSQSKAEEIVALRAEVAIKMQSLSATKVQAQAEFSNALASYKASRIRYVAAQEQMALAQSQMAIAVKNGTAAEIELARQNAQTASLELNNAAIAKNNAHKSVSIAAANSKSASTALESFQTSANTVTQNVNTTSTNLLSTAKTRLAAASRALGLSMLANPYVLVTAAAVGLGYAVYKVVTAETELEKANNRLNEANLEVEKSLASEVSKLTSLEKKLSEAKKGTKEYNDIKKTIVDNYGQYYKGLEGEIERVGNLSTAYEKLIENMRLSIMQKRYVTFFDAEQDNLTKITGEKLDKAYDTLIEKYGKDKGVKLYQQVFNSIIRGTSMPIDTWNELSKATFKEWGFDNSSVGFSIRSVSSLVTDMTSVTQASNKALDDYREKCQLTKEEADKLVSGVSDSSSAPPKDNKTLEQLISSLKTAESKVKSLREQSQKGLIDTSEVDKAVADVDTLKKKYKSMTGKEYGSTKENTLKSEQADRLKAIEDYRKSISDAEVQAEFDIRQVKIDAMDEGSAKELAQINLNYDKLRDVNRKRANDMIKEQQELERKQWEYDNPKWKDKGMTFKPTTTSVQQLSQPQQKRLVSFDSFADISRQKATKEYLDKEKQAMNEYLKEYGSFMEKKQAITDLYNEQISKATTSGEKLSLKKRLDEELKSLDLSEFKKNINFAEVFGNLDNLTTDSVTRLRDKLKDYINKAASGLKPEDLKDLSDALANIEIKAAEKNPFGEIGKSLDDYKQATEGVEQAQDKLNYVMSGGEIVIGLYEDSTGKLCKKLLTQEQAENDLVKAQNKRAESIARLNTALAAGVGKAQDYMDVAKAMVGALEDFGVEVPEQLTGFIDGMGKTLDSLASIDLTKPVSAITGIIGAIGGIGKAIGSLFNNDSKKEKNIERLQEQVDVLDKSYEKLSQSIENAYSTDASNLIDQQNKMLEQQKMLIEQQIAEEESKKHTDDDRIKEWRDQIDEINNTIEDNKAKAQDAIFGSDVKSAIDDFANAYVDAWGAGEDRAKSMKDTVKKMIKGVIVEMMKADLAPTVQALRDKIESALSDGIISDYEQSELDRLIEQATSGMDSKYSWADKYLKGEKELQDGVSGQLKASMTEGTASQLVGLWNSTSIDMRELKHIGQEQNGSVKSILSSVSEIIKQNVLIEQNTRRGADNTDGLIEELQGGFKTLDKRLENIEKNTKTSNSRG